MTCGQPGSRIREYHKTFHERAHIPTELYRFCEARLESYGAGVTRHAAFGSGTGRCGCPSEHLSPVEHAFWDPQVKPACHSYVRNVECQVAITVYVEGSK